MIFKTLNLSPSSPRPWYPLTSPCWIQLSIRILLLIHTFPCLNTLISSRQSSSSSNTDNRGAPLWTLLFFGISNFETGRPPGARMPISIKMSDTPKDGSLLSSRCYSDNSTFSFSVYNNTNDTLRRLVSWHYQAYWDTRPYIYPYTKLSRHRLASWQSFPHDRSILCHSTHITTDLLPLSALCIAMCIDDSTILKNTTTDSFLLISAYSTNVPSMSFFFSHVYCQLDHTQAVLYCCFSSQDTSHD